MRLNTLYALLLVVLMRSQAQQDLGNKVFFFPKETDTAHVVLKPIMKTPLRKLSVCLRSYTDLSRQYGLFSLAMSDPKVYNAFLIMISPPHYCSVYINNEQISIKVDPEVGDWKHTCVTWDSTSGVIQLWINGKLYPRKVSNKGFSINTKINIIVGQEQDLFGGGFNKSQSFVGDLTDIHMWDSVLTPGDIQKVMTNDHTGNVINWRSLNFDITGDALIQPNLQCVKQWQYTKYTQC
ncbi:hypothetical protein GDO81_020218 [Engystomops pustulosus]|uniref:Pentraxin family member n=1 Tax=Engystomops pustulosus TaxID=76066 RepID=A0AAV6ZJY4_ENGPU|nr:hypothetical protein GDO81_020218 [Engystomops pustulosus]KAG8549664.1 hypothetical protein GDO81_020218 [Engystomops pustulosus]